mgnify:CR=1 FL=1
MGRISGIVCCPAVYRFGGYTFEINKISGPWPLKKDGELRKIATEKFWSAYERFSALPEEARKRFCLEAGGCMRIKA